MRHNRINAFCVELAIIRIARNYFSPRNFFFSNVSLLVFDETWDSRGLRTQSVRRVTRGGFTKRAMQSSDVHATDN